MTVCEVCGDRLQQPARGRRRRYCSRACQARAYRARRNALPARARPRPRRLSTVAITRAAIDLADRTDLDGLTMRRLATELGVATAALYRYFDDRDQLLVAMTDLVFAEIPRPSPPPSPVGGRARIQDEARREWQLYRRHPWLLPVLARIRPPLGQSLFDALERTVSALDEPDLPRAQLLSTYLGYSALIQGLALLRNSERVDRIAGTAASVDAAGLAELIDETTRPTLYTLFAPHTPALELDFDELLADTVDMFLDGVAVRRRNHTE